MIAPSPDDNKRMKSIELIETYAYVTSKGRVSEKEEIKCSNINFDHATKESIKEHNPNWPEY